MKFGRNRVINEYLSVFTSANRHAATILVLKFRLKGCMSLEEINLSRQNQNYRFYLFDKSWYFPVKHVIYGYISLLDAASYD